MNLKFVLRAGIDQFQSKEFESPCRFTINMQFKAPDAKRKKGQTACEFHKEWC